MRRLRMGALLGVGQGSRRESRVVIMRWNGGRANDRPVAFIGKGVVFDSGGISIKPGGGMEDMKGDMAGAARGAGPLPPPPSPHATAHIVRATRPGDNKPRGAAPR